MPVAKCVVCQQRWTIKQKDWKFLDQDGPYVCDLPCLLEWIKVDRGFNINRDIPKYQKVINHSAVISGRLHCNFRSHFEASMAKYFNINGLRFFYEYVTFLWNGKEYTPDFYFPQYGCFVEVKGLWQNSNRSKYKDFRRTFPQVDMIIGHWLLNAELPRAEKVIGA